MVTDIRPPISAKLGSYSPLLQLVFSVLPLVWAGLIAATFTHERVLLLSTDDSFYYHVIGRNFAAGLGWTFDGMHPTNGFHPLWHFMLVALNMFLGDPDLILFAAKVCEVALVAMAAASMTLAMLRLGTGLLFAAPFAVVWLANVGLLFGLEASLHLFLLAGSLLLLVELCEGELTWKKSLLMGIWLTMIFWARLESVVFSVACAIGFTLLRARPGRAGFLKLGAVIFICLAGGALMYAALNFYIVGEPVPLSGLVKEAWSQRTWEFRGAAARWHNIWLTFAHPAYLEGLLLSFSAVALAAFSWCGRTCRLHMPPKEKSFDIFIVALAITHVTRTVYSALYIDIAHASVRWYFVPLYILEVAVPLFIIRRLLLLAEYSRPRLLSFAKKLLGVSACTIILLINIHLLVFWFGSPLSQGAIYERLGRGAFASIEVAKWLDATLPRGTIIGMPGAGTVKYFSSQRIVNIDGLVNSPDFLRAFKMGTIGEWLQQAGVDYVAELCAAGSIANGCDCVNEFTHSPSFGKFCTSSGLPEPDIRLGNRRFAIFRVLKGEHVS